MASALIKQAVALVAVLVLSPLLAFGISIGFMRGYWWLGRRRAMGDELSPRGDALVVGRSFLGALAATGLVRTMFQPIGVHVPWVPLLCVVALFLAVDTFWLRLQWRFAHTQQQRGNAALSFSLRRNAGMRMVGDLMGFLAGVLVLW